MNLTKALSLSLGEVVEPVITRYRIGLIVHRLFLEKAYLGATLTRIEKDRADMAAFHDALGWLENAGILTSHPNFPQKVYQLLGRKEENPEEVACSIDPFCYVSHLSAMSHHGLTQRLPSKLFLSGPDAKQWKQEAEKQMQKDLGHELDIYTSEGLPPLARINMTRIGKTEIHHFNSIHWGAYRNVRGRTVRVSTIGRTFLDMLRNPELCGGMRHVIEVFEEHAANFLPAIIGEIDQHGGPIDKVRAGYILDERLRLGDQAIEKWVAFAKRGGSRKLDPTEEYFPVWSEKWCLSLNIG